jgi:hypothetical protein
VNQLDFVDINPGNHIGTQYFTSIIKRDCRLRRRLHKPGAIKFSEQDLPAHARDDAKLSLAIRTSGNIHGMG